MLAKFVPSDAQNKLEFDLMQCDNINQYFAHLKNDNTKLVPDAFVIGGLTSKPFGFRVKNADGNKTDAFEKVRQALDQLPFSLKNNRNNYVRIRYHLVNHHSSYLVDHHSSEVDLHEFMLDDDVKDYVRIDFDVAPWVIVNLYNADRKNFTVDMASFLEARDACQGVYDALYADYCQLRESVTNSFMGPDLDLSNLSLDGNNNEIDDKDEGAVGETEQDIDVDHDSLAKNDQDSDVDDKSNLDPDSKQSTNNNNDNSDDEQNSDSSVDASDSSENESDSETEQDSLAKNEKNSNTDDKSNLDPDSKQNTNSNDDNSDDEQNSDNSVDGSDSGENESDSETEQDSDAGDETIDKAASTDNVMNNQSESKNSVADDPESSKVESESNSVDDENSNSKSESDSTASGDTLSESSRSETDDMPHVGMTDKTTDQNNDSLADDGQSASSESSSVASENQSTASESSSASTGESSVQSSQPKESVPTVPVLRDITNEGNDDERELYRTLINALKRIDDKKTQPARSKEQEDFYRKLVERLDKVGDVHNSSNVQLETRLQEKLLSAIDRFLATTEEQREKDRLAREAAERQAKEEALLKKEEAGKTERQKFTDDQDKMIANLLNENLSAE